MPTSLVARSEHAQLVNLRTSRPSWLERSAPQSVRKASALATITCLHATCCVASFAPRDKPLKQWYVSNFNSSTWVRRAINYASPMTRYNFGEIPPFGGICSIHSDTYSNFVRNRSLFSGIPEKLKHNIQKSKGKHPKHKCDWQSRQKLMPARFGLV